MDVGPAVGLIHSFPQTWVVRPGTRGVLLWFLLLLCPAAPPIPDPPEDALYAVKVALGRLHVGVDGGRLPLNVVELLALSYQFL